MSSRRFSKKTNKRCYVVKSNTFVRFFGETLAWQFAFKIKWPLALGNLWFSTSIKRMLKTWLVSKIRLYCKIAKLWLYILLWTQLLIDTYIKTLMQCNVKCARNCINNTYKGKFIQDPLSDNFEEQKSINFFYS